jgi:crossover junction endodeoxyribonuclease RuvC
MDAFPQAVAPREWQKPYGLGKGDKGASRATVLRLYPAAPVTRVKDHNRAEAILIAHYGMEQTA